MAMQLYFPFFVHTGLSLWTCGNVAALQGELGRYFSTDPEAGNGVDAGILMEFPSDFM